MASYTEFYIAGFGGLRVEPNTNNAPDGPTPTVTQNKAELHSVPDFWPLHPKPPGPKYPAIRYAEFLYQKPSGTVLGRYLISWS